MTRVDEPSTPLAKDGAAGGGKSGAQRSRGRKESHATGAPTASERCIHHLFEEQVTRTPHATAVVQGELSLTYAELNALANRLAHQLIARGVGPETRVGLCAVRHPRMIVGLLAILKAGGANVSLDPIYPKERLRELLHDAEPLLLICDAAGGEAIGLDQLELPLLLLEEQAPAGAEADSNPDVKTLTTRNLAYVIYTSGSTGRPKGVMVEHRSLTNLSAQVIELFGLCPGERVLQLASASFDAAVEEIYPCLVAGATLVLRSDEMLASVEEFLARCREMAITVFTLPTSYWHQVVASLAADGLTWPECIRLALIGGEAGQPSRLATWHRSVPPTTRLLNIYGPTEATVFCTAADLSQPEIPNRPGELSIGKPLPNLRVHLLDEHEQPVAPGAVGEIYIGGVGVARGYLKRPALTAERFVPDPFAGEAGARMYRTGDLARHLPDGGLEFLGRNDHQVKVHGYRIELGEVEARLLEHSAVREAVVIVREDAAGDKHLVAYVTTAASAPAEVVTTLRQHLAARLPQYMVPGAIVKLDKLPLTPSGKIDRNALPKPALRLITTDHQARTVTEQELAEIWRDVLRLPSVGAHDNFFDLGGNSLAATQVAFRLARAGAVIPLAKLYRNPVLSDLARVVEEARALPAIAASTKLDVDAADAAALRQRFPDAEEIFPLNDMQAYFLVGSATASPAFLNNDQVAFTIRGRLQLESFKAALARVIERHPTLRASLHWKRLKAPLQVVHAQVPLPLEYVDLSRLSFVEYGDHLNRKQLAELMKPFVLDAPPLLRLLLLRAPDDTHEGILTVHHALIDGPSCSMLLGDLIRIYGDLVRGQDSALPPAPRFSRHVAYTASQDSREAETFWKEQLAGFAPLEFRQGYGTPGQGLPPWDPYVRRVQKWMSERQLQRAERKQPDLRALLKQFPLATTERSQGMPGAEAEATRYPSFAHTVIRDFAARRRVTIHTLAQAAYALLLMRECGRRSVVFGSVFENRPTHVSGSDTVVGACLNMLPLPIAIVEGERTHDWITRIHESLIDIRRFEATPLFALRRWAKIPDGAPFLDVNYVGQARGRDTIEAPESPVSFVNTRMLASAPWRLCLGVSPSAGDALDMYLVYNTMRFQKFDAYRMSQHLQALLAAIVSSDSQQRTTQLLDLALEDRGLGAPRSLG